MLFQHFILLHVHVRLFFILNLLSLIYTYQKLDLRIFFIYIIYSKVTKDLIIYCNNISKQENIIIYGAYPIEYVNNLIYFIHKIWAFGDNSGKELTCQSRRHMRCGFSPRVVKIYWRREWQPTPVFSPEESHGQRSLVRYSL